ncbi:arylacetamide deacetylase-like 3 [Crotalus tigris]|uniref:arylacetamide deacetylase-like 3 n=1 Tax=Crotalus tigris TaxID=88082 RepID=UPI00192F179C|nr:arylacetamide deacetylase-like 3 [Crotalus tigris]
MMHRSFLKSAERWGSTLIVTRCFHNGRGREDKPPFINPGPSIFSWISYSAATDSLAEQEKNLSQARCNVVLREAPGLPSGRRRHLPSRLSAVSPYPIQRNCVSSWDRSTPESPHLSDDIHHRVNFDSYERVLRHVAKEGDATVVAVGYGLAPENLYPSQYIECLKAVVYLMKHLEDYGVDSSRIIISGDSCGANFATRICQLLVDRRDLPKVHAQVLIYPGLQGLDFSLPSYQQNCRSPLMWKKLIAYLCCRYLNKSTSFVNEILKSSHVPKATQLKYQKWLNANNIPEQFKVRGYREQDHTLSSFNPQFHKEMKEMLSETFSPLLAEDAVVCKLPQTFLLTCEFDVLRDDGLLYMKRLIDNGVPVTWSHVENGMHGIMPLFGYGILSFPSAKRIVHDVTDFIRRL